MLAAALETRRSQGLQRSSVWPYGPTAHSNAVNATKKKLFWSQFFNAVYIIMIGRRTESSFNAMIINWGCGAYEQVFPMGGWGRGTFPFQKKSIIFKNNNLAIIFEYNNFHWKAHWPPGLKEFLFKILARPRRATRMRTAQPEAQASSLIGYRICITSSPSTIRYLKNHAKTFCEMSL